MPDHAPHIPHTLQAQLAATQAPDSILTARCRSRMAAMDAAEQLQAIREAMSVDDRIRLVDRLIAERRHRSMAVDVERRGLNPQRNGYEDQSDIATAFAADQTTPKD